MNNFKAGIYKQQLEYKSFLPAQINRQFEITDKEILLLLEQASSYLGRLEAYSQLVPDIDLFIKMHIYKEATLSSKIEGTQTTMDEAVIPEELVIPENKDDWSEIQNYTKAINFAKEQLEHLPVSARLITNIHAILLQGVRGEHKNPGEIRRSQNWIGGSSLKDAFFIPPHFEDLPDLLSDLEAFWHNKNIQIPILVKIAIFHYQFETLHPFCDGNGRIGRLLIPLMLISENILSLPSLYISSFFEKHKGSYYDSLTVVRASNNIDQWVKFFLSGIIDTAKNGTSTLKNVVEFKKNLDHKIISLGSRAKLAEELIKIMFVTPVINTHFANESLNVSYGKTSRLIKEMISLGILKEKKGLGRIQYFELDGYLNLFK
jgi:Fic family protein